MKDIYFEASVYKPTIRKKISRFVTHWLTELAPALSLKLATKILGNPFSRRVYEMRTMVQPSVVWVPTSLGDVCLQKFQLSTSVDQQHIFLCHGWGDSSTRFTQLIDHLLEAGFTVWSLDQVGHGKSKGNASHLYAFIEGSQKALHYMESINATPQAVIGHSMGALAVINQPSAMLKGKKIILISAPSLYFENMYDAVTGAGIAKAMLTNLLEGVSKAYNIRWQELALNENLAKVDKSFLFMHDTTDPTCAYAATKGLLEDVQHEFFTTNNLGHIKLLKDSALHAKIVEFSSAALQEHR